MSDHGEDNPDPRQDNPSPQMVEQVFSMFKGYLSSQLDTKGKQLEVKSKLDKEAADLKFKGNRKQFEFNSQLVCILTQVQDAVDNPGEISKLVSEGKKLLKKRQKLIKIADRSKDGWLIVQEYESDDLASDSKDEKKLRKAKNAVEKKRKEVKSGCNNASKRFKTGSDSQLFRGKIIQFVVLCDVSGQFWLPEHPTIFVLFVMNSVHLGRK